MNWEKVLGLFLSTLLFVFLQNGLAHSAVPAGYSQFYVPGDEDNLMFIMNDLDTLDIGQGMRSIISIVASADNTVVYYDHWEDGYTFDPNDPVATSDEVFTLASKGSVQTLESASIPVPRVASAEFYDGRDMIFVSGGVPTVTRTSWSEDSGTLQALSWEVYPVKPQLTTYNIPFGEELALASPAGKGYRDFDRVYALIQATEDNTVVTVDLNRDGTLDQIDFDHDGTPDGHSITLNKGEIYRLDRDSIYYGGGGSFSYDFESPLNESGFSVGAPDGTNWELGNPTQSNGNGPGDCRSGVNCWGTDLDNEYVDNIGSITLDSPNHDFSGYSNVVLNFYEWLEIEGQNYDYARLYSNVNNGGWVERWEYNAGERLDSNWSQFTHDASAYAGNNTNVRWRWELETDGSVTEMGWYIDDVSITYSSAGGAAGILTGAIIKADKTVQVQYVIGDENQTWEIRGLSAFPRGFWDDEYYAPVDGPSTKPNETVDIYIHNPHSTSLTINFETLFDTGSFTIAPGDTSSFSDGVGYTVPAGTAVYLKGDDVFWGISTIEAEGRDYDWGYALIPALMLENEHYMGWAPGSTAPNTTAGEDDSGVFITAVQDNTTVYVDLDPTSPGPIQTYSLDRLETQYLYDNVDGIFTAARIWATGPIAMAYGQNPDTATTQTPAIDVGYTTIPGGSLIDKVLTVEKTADPAIVPVAQGSETTFTILVNSYDYPMDDVSAVDTLPPGWEYVVSSTNITRADFTTSIADPSISGSDLSWSSSILGSLNPNQHITITFRARTNVATFLVGDVSMNNVVINSSRTIGSAPPVTQIFTASDFAYVTYGDLEVTKVSSVNETTPLSPGDEYTYTVTVTNPLGSSETITGITLYDPLPPGIEYVAATAAVTGYKDAVARDEFSTVSYANNDGTIDFLSNWVEVDSSGGGATSGYVRVENNTLRILGGSSRSIRRAIDLSAYSGGSLTLNLNWDTGGNLESGDDTYIQISTNGSSWTNLAQFNNDPPGSGPSTPYDISGFAVATAQIRILTDYSSSSGDYINIDNIEINAGVQLITVDPISNLPPGFVDNSDGYQLAPGQSMTLSFTVKVDDPLATGINTITNTAFVSADQYPQPISATATNIVNVSNTDSASIAGRVWFDEDAEGDVDLGETGFANVVVDLKDEFGTIVLTTTTDSAGNYIFTGVAPGNGYYVEIDSGLPPGLIQTAPSGHSDDRSDDIDVVAGQAVTDINLGYTPPAGSATIGDLVWHDVDNDRVQDPGEPGLAGVTVTLYNDLDGDGTISTGDTVRATTTSGVDGSYLFTGIPADNTLDYLVTIIPADIPTNYTIDASEQVIIAENLSPDTAYLGYDFGLQSSVNNVEISGTIYHDVVTHGPYDTGNGDVGLVGVTIELLDASGNVIATTITSSDPSALGDYSFTGLVGGGADYTVRVADTGGILNSYYGTSAEAIAKEIDIINLTTNRENIDFGYDLERALGGTVYRDLNATTPHPPYGSQDAGEPGIAGITVLLYKDVDNDGLFEPGLADGNSIAMHTTDANGDYLFTGLDDGPYFIYVDNAQPQLVGLTHSTLDADSIATGHQLFHDLTGGVNSLDLDFGYYSTDKLTISGIVWEDNNAQNGAVDGPERKLANVTVELYKFVSGSYVLFDTKTSGSNGLYEFVDLDGGDYLVRVTDQNNVLNGMRTVYEKTEGAIAANYNYEEVVTLSTGTGNINDVNFGYLLSDPTYALVNNFRIFELNRYNVVEWQTSSEFGTLGFDLLRRDDSGKYVKINSRLISSILNSPKNVYQCIDAGMSLDSDNSYMLREHQARGLGRTYGPFTLNLAESVASVNDTISRKLSLNGHYTERIAIKKIQTNVEDYISGDMAMMRSADIALDGAQMDTSGPVTVKVSIKETGIYKVPIAQLASLTSMPVGTIEDLVVAGKMSASNKGNKVFFVTDEPLTAIYFYGEEHSTIFSDTNVYQLTFTKDIPLGDVNEDGATGVRDAIFSLKVLAGYDVADITADFSSASADVNYNGRLDLAEIVGILNGVESDDAQLMATVSGGDPSSAVAEGPDFRQYSHFENDNYEGLSFPVSSDLDYWFWSYFNDSNSSESFPLTVSGNFNGDEEVLLSVYFYGLSEQNSATLQLNPGTLGAVNLGTFSWTGKKNKRFIIQLKNSDLIDGENHLKITRVDNGENIFALDSFSLKYRRVFTATNNMLKLEAGGNDTVTVRGFDTAGIMVFDVTDIDSPDVVVDTLITDDGGVFSTTFATHGDKNVYVAFSFDATLDPVSMVVDTKSYLKTTDQGAQYVVVSADDFVTVSQMLANHRNQDGMSAKVVSLSDIFDEFSFGIYDPTAIREFVKYAVDNWDIKPQYITLIGDGTYDYKDHHGLGGNFMPALMSNTPHGIFPADNLYTDLDDDGMPDLPIGRIAATTNTELAIMIGKIIEYEGSAVTNEVLIVADQDDSIVGNDFTVASENFAALIGAGYQKDRIYVTSDAFPVLPYYSVANSTNAIIAGINDNPFFLNYIGHGGIDQLSRDAIFTSSDVSALTNSGYPVFTALTCLVGNFSSPFLDSMAEVMTRRAGGGFVAAWSPSGLSENSEAVKINTSFMEAVFVDGEKRLGNAILQALNDYGQSDHLPYMVNVFNLLGDPALKLK